jgi:hypothetical protein
MINPDVIRQTLKQRERRLCSVKKKKRDHDTEQLSKESKDNKRINQNQVKRQD